MTSEQQYLDLAYKVLTEGESVEDRTNTGTLSVFGAMLRYNLSEGFPLYTTKRINFNNISGELLWFLSGDTTLGKLRYYSDKEIGSRTIWSDDFEKFWEATFDGNHYKGTEDGGRIYGYQWRRLDEIDQIGTLIKNIKLVKESPNHSMGRRLIVSSWNPLMLIHDKRFLALPACHTDFQCIVRGNKLSLKFNCRSNDLFLGHPYNVASYALLCHILAKITGLEVGELVYVGVDVHIYSNHIEQMKLQLERTPREFPTLIMPEFSDLKELLQYTAKDFILDGYDPYPTIKAKQAS